MGSRPTFHLVDDYVALMDLKPAERTVYGLLRCNTAFGRNGVATHTVHVTAAWFTEMTAHWETPMAASTARRGINGLIDKGVLVRLNQPQDGAGFLLAFVADPRGRIDGPTNGFEHAKKVSRRCGGMKAVYDRRDEIPGTPAVTGVRLGRKGSESYTSAPEQETPKFDDVEGNDLPEESEVWSATEESEEVPPEQPAPKAAPASDPQVVELAHLLLRKSKGKGLNRQGLLEGQARRVAQECAPRLADGWTPDALATQLMSLVSAKIHTMDSFLIAKSRDVGSPPEAPQADGTAMIDGKVVDLGAFSWDDQPQEQGEVNEARDVTPSPVVPSPDSEAKRERLAHLARIARSGGN